MDGVFDEERPGAPRTVTDDIVKRVIVKALEGKPADSTHWSTRSMAEPTGMSATTTECIWRAFELRPHRSESSVLRVNEKGQIQALNRSPPIPPIMPGAPERASHDHKRHGTTSPFAAFDMANGKVIGFLRAHHHASKLKTFLERIDTEVPDDLDVHLILDSYATHEKSAIKR